MTDRNYLPWCKNNSWHVDKISRERVDWLSVFETAVSDEGVEGEGDGGELTTAESLTMLKIWISST
jgi:hypothetical protein